MPKCIYGMEFYSSENCCYGYQIQINNQFYAKTNLQVFKRNDARIILKNQQEQELIS